MLLASAFKLGTLQPLKQVGEAASSLTNCSPATLANLPNHQTTSRGT